ncbi:hypothetical protein OROHE_019106 [Orobanche hederae]
MGNCLVLEEKLVRVIKTDGKILEYKSPIKVHRLLSEFSHHAISDTLPVIKHMHPNADMLRGRLYYLLPLQGPPSQLQPIKKKKKRVRFSDDVRELGDEIDGKAARIKLVIGREELRAVLSNEGVSVDDMIIYKVRKEENTTKAESCCDGDDHNNVISKKWSPCLKSIPEGN